ncbi:hypothetical protein B5C34_10630 [Pacificimonas flava]|uniref:DUF2975 domain-containing protein n=2 Tax=Pacificimonas TaxID=1960290 RepID=A0A219B6V1_9SPHN|nr:MULTISPECIES: hypothetical protein [Pacificimonas]MBZ6378875.1 hypothetical protein [Pacificimonas aurantium]OWV33873.1 hypothetical protein B5C34_10630 [Pacificimonas flava]
MTPEARRRRIAAASTAMAYALVALSLLLPLAAGASIFLMPAAELAQGAGVPQAASQPMPVPVRMAANLVLLLPSLLTAGALLTLAGLFRRFAAGAFFSPPAFKALKRFAALLFLGALAGILASPAAGLALFAVADEASLSIRIGTPNIFPMLLAAGVWILGWILGEAAEIEAENRQFV